MATIGYVRVSTDAQEMALQQDAMASAKADKVFTDEGISGTKTERPGLTAALDYLREGDELVVWRLDRLGRNLGHVRQVIEELTDRGVKFRSLTEGLSNDGITGKLMITILAAFAEFEVGVIRERTRAGLQAARLRGHVGGRPPALTRKQIDRARKLREDGLTVPEVAKVMEVGTSTMYRLLAKETV